MLRRLDTKIDRMTKDMQDVKLTNGGSVAARRRRSRVHSFVSGDSRAAASRWASIQPMPRAKIWWRGIGSTKAQVLDERADLFAFTLWQMGVPGYELK